MINHNAFCLGVKNMNLKEKTFRMLNYYGLKAKKRFGQNFLIDESIVDNIVEKSNISSEDVVIEIGPGLGNLTEKLIDRAKLVLAFEIDEDMIRVLNDRFKDKTNLVVISKDILQVDLEQILIENGVGENSVRVVANLPYYITTPIMFKLFKYTKYIKTMTIMVQKEVAERIVAIPGSKDYGVLSINTRYYGTSKKLFDVPNISFTPAPNVTSAVVKIDINIIQGVQNEDMFFKLVKASFAQRRKKIINSIENSNMIDISKDKLRSILEKNNISDNTRAEEINIEKYITISNDIYNEIKK